MVRLRFALLGLPALMIVAAIGLLYSSWPATGAWLDFDGDGWRNDEETAIGTDLFLRCAATPQPDDEPAPDAWPVDFNDDQQTNILDIVQLTPPAFNTSPPDPNYSVRKDISPDGTIDILDIVLLTPPTFNTSCIPTPVDIAIDMDITGNDARLSGGADIQTCAEISVGGSVEIDVILPLPGIAPAEGFEGFQFDLQYDPAVVEVTVEDHAFLISELPGSAPISASDPVPDSTGAFTSAVADLGVPVAREDGPGVLTRITLTGMAQGTTDLTFANVIIVDADVNSIPVSSALGAAVSVDMPCTPPPSPAPTPTPSPIPTPEPCADTDGDGFTDCAEAFIGTDPLDDCPPPDDAWPPDFDNTGWPSILDVMELMPPVFNTSPPDPNYSQRKDLTADGAINILDLALMMPPLFHTNCPLP